MKRLSVALIIPLIWVAPGRRVTAQDNPPKPVQYVLGINQDASLTLDGKSFTRGELAQEWPRLAGQLQEEAKAAGKAVDPKQGLPAVILIRAADETLFSLIYALVLEAQKGGFQNFALTGKSRYPAPPPIPSSRPAVPAGPTELSEVLHTIPIGLHADQQGNIGRVTLGEVELADFKVFRSELSRMQDDPDTLFDRAILTIDPKLMFSELIRVINFLAKHKIPSVSLIEPIPTAGH